MTAPDDLVARDAAAFFHQHGSSPCVSALRAAHGLWLEDMNGRRFIDLHGNTVHHIGHAHPEIVAALKQQLDDLAFAPRRYTNAPAVALAQALLTRWPGPPARVLFATGGSDAIEIALKLARVATGRFETVSLEGSYHGHGFGAFGLSSATSDPRLGAFLPGRHHVTPYWVGEDGPARMLEAIAGHLATGRIAAVIAEPMRSNCHVPPADLWPRVRALCDAHGTKLIFDEIPSGLGKTGRFFAFEHFGAMPDMAVLGKALGGGMVPIAAVIGDARLNVAPELELGHYTHEKNPLTTRAALTLLEIIARDDLVVRARDAGGRLAAGVADIAARVPGVRGTRGLGLLLTVEFDATCFGQAPGPAFAEHLVATCFAHGLSTTAKGGAAIGLSLPLTVTEAEIVEVLGRIEAVAGRL
ncbi:aminotransferase class III-fold pyridoxal phosphate-dependent enzyme [Ancylobacter dichloromethanicus]|uniref:Aspartate aminotransferase family protein n=1 Tax=Ancylobacter dichloromethanicus TaxID=518825 RepID=A0A9W6JFL0_9HYPH|nr:aminotransferase class III-fold pyridoxal phosphate-dependent enzyme [Ancylobacter dichloromethanicus]MBS7553131.1 aminotransferase class III-fold pyridoxal phosphate-dependent enzyme [Ancylobacter dichloromethanicus]GLK74648.1 aspartate aminotransferase family protein [Ancylobacter dichloromethanicus]